VKGGRLVGSLTVNDTRGRRWTDRDVELLAETAERTWAAVERARAEAALRESQAILQSFYDTAPFLMGIGEGRWSQGRLKLRRSPC
jgi:GAF domain-containing protein